MTRELLIIGGGEHSRVVLDAASSSGMYALLGFVDPRPCPQTIEASGLVQLDGDEIALAVEVVARGGQLGLGVSEIGVGSRRRLVVGRFPVAEEAWAAIVHARAWVSPSARLGPGVVVMAGAVVNARAEIGAFSVVNTGAVVEHDVRVGAYAHVGPGATIGGGASIADDAYVGLGSRVRDHVSVGRSATVGLGAAVVADVVAHTIVVGVPARPRKTAGRTRE